MKIIIDIPDEVYKNVKDHNLFLPNCIHSSIENGTVLPKGHGDLIDLNALKGELWWVSDCPHIKLNEQALEIWRTIEKAPTIIEADKGNKG